MRLSSIFTRIKTIDARSARAWMEERSAKEYTLLDVRQPEEYEEGHIPGALLIPLTELAERAGEIPKDIPVLAY